MSSGFLTVEDINTLDINTVVNEYFVVDTSLIGTDEFSNVQYDFVKVSHTISENQHIFTFEIHNSLWCGGYWFSKSNGDYIDMDATLDNNNTITFTTNQSSLKLHLYLCSYALEFYWIRLEYALDDMDTIIITKKELGVGRIIYFTSLKYGSRYYTHIRLYEGVTEWSQLSGFYSYNLVQIKKTDLVFNFNNDCLVGKINHIPLGVDQKYLPGGSMVDDTPLNMEIVYGDAVLPVTYDDDIGDYCFDLDLSNKLDTNSVKVSLKVTSNTYVNNGVFDIIIPCEYVTISNEVDLMTQLALGIKVLKLDADIGLTSNIQISSDVIVYGEDKKLTLNNHSIILNEGVKLILENAELNIGSPAIIQKENSILELTKVKFTNNIAADYNNLGSCIFCDVDLESLSVDSDFTTRINDCTFINNHSAIFHGGQLTVDNCKYLNNDLTYVDKDNPAFLYQTDGDAEITNSIFDIDYQDNTLCENQINIGFAQALIRCGLTATINTATHESLQEDNKLPFFDSYRNQSHVFAKYYYPQIETCVFTSPVEDKENESICYCVTGTDWVYKTNAVVTRADWQSENTINKIDWEGI